jgi:hypothetical protein
MTKYTDYTAYFEQIARDLFGHTDIEKHFFRKGLEEFLNGMVSTVNYPALLLLKYDYTYDDHGADNMMKVRTIAFIVCDHVSDQEDYTATDSACDITEVLVDKIFNRIYKDIREPRHEFMQYAELGNVQVTPIENYADGNHGYFVTIQILSHHNTSIL